MNAWSELPNAKHIDWVLESIRSNTDIWIQAYKQAYDQTRYRAYGQAYGQAWIQAYGQAWIQAYDQARGVLLALIAYDDCEKYLSMTYSELKTWALISETPQAVLLLPMVYVKELT